MSNPTVDILMATYNGERFVGEQIESIQRQTYRNWRLLVSDDCSSDGTLDIVKAYAAGDSRISVSSEGVRYGGAKKNFMSLLMKSDSPYVMFCDQDDVWLPEKIEMSLTELRGMEGPQSNSPCLVFTDMEVVDSNLNLMSPSFERDSNIDPTRTSFPQVLAQSLGAGCTMVVNRPLVKLMTFHSDHDGMIMHDHWATIVAAAFGSIGYIDKPLSLYRQHGDNTIGADSFSIVDRATHMSRMRDRYIDNVRQAATFGSVYRAFLSEGQMRTIEQCSRTITTGPIRGIIALFRSRCWKKGVRKIGQIIVVLTTRIG